MLDEQRNPRVVVVVEGGSRQLIGVYDKDTDIPIHTGEIGLYNPLQFIGVPAQQNPDGYMMGPLLPTVPVEELRVDVSSIFEVEEGSKLYNKYITMAKEIIGFQMAAAAGLSLAREMPKGGSIIGGR